MKEIEVGTFEAKNRLSALVDEAAKGQRVWITKRGKRVALLCSGQDKSTAAETPEELLARFRKLRRSARKGPETLKSLIEEGRR
jgi:prevent-host-death family protein